MISDATIPVKRGKGRPPSLNPTASALYQRALKAKRKGKPVGRRNLAIGRHACGLKEGQWTLISPETMALSETYFWGRRGLAIPEVSPGVICVSQFDFQDEVKILRMRTA